jgi:hypothetical protein
MKRFKRLLIDSMIYRATSVFVQVSILALITNIGFLAHGKWGIVVACNVICTIWYLFFRMLISPLCRSFMGQDHYIRHEVEKTVSLYFSHPIRGSAVEKASLDVQMSNSERAAAVEREIHFYMPHLDIYVPGYAERFVGYSYKSGMLTDSQILEIDCKILQDCDGVIVYDFDTSKGVEIEVAYAIEHGIPVFRFKEFNQRTLKDIQKFTDRILNRRDV